jgi:alpha-glucosidase (family GH31 glycosyl hydrolase)
MERILLGDGTVVTDFRKGNLLGTARTLDNVNGSTSLEKGIMSLSGVAVMDDSNSLLLDSNGAILPREECRDLYYFAYGHDYKGCLKDFFALTGKVPLIPKFALGNWWSRYRAYTQAEYQALMQQFIDRRLPITVATIDMDWHWTDVVQRFGKEALPGAARSKQEEFFNRFMPGWTGYTWNTELFPDHRGLLDWLHERNFKVTLNVHPSQGIRFFEDCYEEFCKRMDMDPSEKKQIEFDVSDTKFMEAYFDVAHHCHERDGVDFWWLDWQQGMDSKIPGFDPLWALNHYHSLDSGADRTRPLILSRYAGLGSHRYPLGFSGDTYCTWESLDFQPYFTNNASNAGYTWWSHDIGGHYFGVQDDELYLRWLQYGVFSPINRLHSTCSEYMGKEPWKRSFVVQTVSEQFLRLRHKLIPYLYSANYRTHTDGIPVCIPLYYEYDCEDAYKAKNQYIFG